MNLNAIALIAAGALVAVMGLGSSQAALAAAPEQPSRADTSKKETRSTPAKRKKAAEKPTRPAGYRGDPTDKYGSRETDGQRNERLTRECRGAVNAGACAGYTR
ncbi:MAG: hypothetical protein LH479_03885 [Polaromonas sp.]|nr:hypothetical protein [Polaromonas sp.]